MYIHFRFLHLCYKVATQCLRRITCQWGIRRNTLQLLPPAHLMRRSCSPKGLSIRKTRSRSNAGIRRAWKMGQSEWAPILKRRLPGLWNKLKAKAQKIRRPQERWTANSLYTKKSTKPRRPTLHPQTVKEWKKMVLTHFLVYHLWSHNPVQRILINWNQN